MSVKSTIDAVNSSSTIQLFPECIVEIPIIIIIIIHWNIFLAILKDLFNRYTHFWNTVLILHLKGYATNDNTNNLKVTTCRRKIIFETFVFSSALLRHCSWRGVIYTTLCDKVCQWLVTDQWFSHGTSLSSTNKTDSHGITEILLKVTLNTITLFET